MTIERKLGYGAKMSEKLYKLWLNWCITNTESNMNYVKLDYTSIIDESKSLHTISDQESHRVLFHYWICWKIEKIDNAVMIIGLNDFMRGFEFQWI